MRQNFFVQRRLFGFSLYLALDLAEHDKFICVGLLATTIDFQIAQHERAFTIAFEKYEWIERQKFRLIKHVGIRLACSDNETGLVYFCIGHTYCYAVWNW